MKAADCIRVKNILDEAYFAFLAGTPDGLRRAEEHLAEARTLVAFERRLLEEAAS